MKQHVQAGGQLGADERDLLSAAFKGKLNACRQAARAIAELQYQEKASGNEPNANLATNYLAKKSTELTQICNDAVTTIDSIVPLAKTAEELCFFYKMRGDYLRYKTEWSGEGQREEAAQMAAQSYQAGMDQAAQLPAIHPVRLGLSLNYSVFLHEVYGDTQQAIQKAVSARDEAAGLEQAADDPQ